MRLRHAKKIKDGEDIATFKHTTLDFSTECIARSTLNLEARDLSLDILSQKVYKKDLEISFTIMANVVTQSSTLIRATINRCFVTHQREIDDLLTNAIAISLDEDSLDKSGGNGLVILISSISSSVLFTIIVIFGIVYTRRGNAVTTGIQPRNSSDDEENDLGPGMTEMYLSRNTTNEDPMKNIEMEHSLDVEKVTIESMTKNLVSSMLTKEEQEEEPFELLDIDPISAVESFKVTSLPETYIYSKSTREAKEGPVEIAMEPGLDKINSTTEEDEFMLQEYIDVISTQTSVSSLTFKPPSRRKKSSNDDFSVSNKYHPGIACSGFRPS